MEIWWVLETIFAIKRNLLKSNSQNDHFVHNLMNLGCPQNGLCMINVLHNEVVF